MIPWLKITNYDSKSILLLLNLNTFVKAPQSACKNLTQPFLGFDFGHMLATAANNLEQLELELRTTLLGKMAGQVGF